MRVLTLVMDWNQKREEEQRSLLQTGKHVRTWRNILLLADFNHQVFIACMEYTKSLQEVWDFWISIALSLLVAAHHSSIMLQYNKRSFWEQGEGL